MSPVLEATDVNLLLGSYFHLGPLAQSVEQRTFNPWVVGSIPTGPTLPISYPHSHFQPNFRPGGRKLL